MPSPSTILVSLLLVVSTYRGSATVVASGSIPRNASMQDRCMDPYRDPTQQCWDVLQVSEYLQDWWSNNSASCNGPDYQGSGFASCFQQKHKLGQQQCQNFSISDCPPPTELDERTMRESYVLYSIYAVYKWYNSIYFASELSTLQSCLVVTNIVTAINPVLPGHTSLGVILTALAAGFSFFTLPSGNAASKLFTQSTAQAPSLIKGLMQTGTLDSELKQIGDIQSNLDVVVEQFLKNLADSLYTVQTDFSIFSALVANGSFIAPQPSLSAITSDMTRTLKTYIVSQALQANNIVFTVARNLSAFEVSMNIFDPPPGEAYANPYQPQYQGTILEMYKGHINCSEGPDPTFNLCDNWWIDVETSDSYSLVKLDDQEMKYNDLLLTIFDNHWTTGEDLFKGADSCTEDSGIYLPFPPLYFNTPFPRVDVGTGSITAHCFSNARICAWNQSDVAPGMFGHEFEDGGGCQFAWPNLCINGSGFSPNSSYPNGSGNTTILPPYQGNAYAVVDNLGGGPVSSSFIGYQISSIHVEGSEDFLTDFLLAYNSLYDVVNNNVTALSNQAKETDKYCKDNPFNTAYIELPGWGGAGYHRSGSGCLKMLASYLGLGLHGNREFCT